MEVIYRDAMPFLLKDEEKKTIMPQPFWCQEAAMVGFAIDELRSAFKEIKGRMEGLEK